MMLWVSVVLKRLSTSLTSFIDLSNQDHVRLQKQKGNKTVILTFFIRASIIP